MMGNPVNSIQQLSWSSITDWVTRWFTSYHHISAKNYNNIIVFHSSNQAEITVYDSGRVELHQPGSIKNPTWQEWEVRFNSQREALEHLYAIDGINFMLAQLTATNV